MITDEQSTQDTQEGRSGVLIAAFAVLHLICCGLPLLLLSGVSLAVIVPSWPLIGGFLAVIGVVGFAWYLKRGCATCPRNEGRCPAQRSRGKHLTKSRSLK